MNKKIASAFLAKHRYADPGNKGLELGYAKPDFSDKDWQAIDLPRTWQSTGTH